MIASLVVLLIFSPQSTLPALISGGTSGLNFALVLFASYAVWLSILNILSKLKFDAWLGKTLQPALKKLFPNENDTAYGFLSVNLSANMLGMGGAATPAGISAMENLTTKKNRIMLLVINSTSVQLIPTTILGMRASAGARTDIILPALIATFASTVFGVILVKVFVK